MNFDDPQPNDKRKQQLIYLRPSLKDAIERERLKAGQSRSVWIERAIMAQLRRASSPQQ